MAFDRRPAAKQKRNDAADAAFAQPFPAQTPNGDEAAYASRSGNFSKGVLLGERVALQLLGEFVTTVAETCSFTVRKFDGSTVVISN